MQDDIKCPYCGKEQEINHDDGYGYEEDIYHEQECCECEKIFTFQTSIHYYYTVRKADCLNDGEHEMERVSHYPEHYPNWERCKNCEHEIKGSFTEQPNS